MKLHNEISYLSGFGNEHETEALPGALPVGQFNPQRCAYGLYAEQFSSTAFTAPRHCNRRSWLYRIRPSVAMNDFEPLGLLNQNTDKTSIKNEKNLGAIKSAPLNDSYCPPNNMRWDPIPIPTQPTDFIDGLTTIAANGNVKTKAGIAIHIYTANKSMENRYFYNADGELLIVPELGDICAYTEFGLLYVEPGDILVIPRGIKFKIMLINEQARGYICENYGQSFTLPERGPVGANGYANDRDFEYPKAYFEDIDEPCELITKFFGQLYRAKLNHSPLDVVAWVGTSAPYKYQLSRFNVINSVSFDHPDPSIFTVLTSPSFAEGTANVDFVIFPPRWQVSEHTFRPPWYHRNTMSEFMGLIKGQYEAKPNGFLPGGMSLHNCMSPHGPEAEVFEQAVNGKLIPEQHQDTLAFMFESHWVIEPTEFALHTPLRQTNYMECWANLKKYFNGQP
ncbi:homogentisate 1,2-dioxygenase [Marinibactrum halimedae]|uniref:Homogentisate 1,2-dioxygenase n=1 Tax=Marinibactrum halimedae TaxID=1444977 RepID=A0AA37T714_9GAMM|nr:homogentisate 1,2-dioxygenase [Marinibactrum halimedae]MCD9457627.1 homogentisate 1,2-dioxygenase [Marinibactrum halimedae]GLS28049.1 homogentisate 1,2-dioxygenase [Marinibactrum halimedae]